MVKPRQVIWAGAVGGPAASHAPLRAGSPGPGFLRHCAQHVRCVHAAQVRAAAWLLPSRPENPAQPDELQGARAAPAGKDQGQDRYHAASWSLLVQLACYDAALTACTTAHRSRGSLSNGPFIPTSIASHICCCWFDPCQTCEHAQPGTAVIIHALLSGMCGTLQAQQLHEAHLG